MAASFLETDCITWKIKDFAESGISSEVYELWAEEMCAEIAGSPVGYVQIVEPVRYVQPAGFYVVSPASCFYTQVFDGKRTDCETCCDFMRNNGWRVVAAADAEDSPSEKLRLYWTDMKKVRRSKAVGAYLGGGSVSL